MVFQNEPDINIVSEQITWGEKTYIQLNFPRVDNPNELKPSEQEFRKAFRDAFTQWVTLIHTFGLGTTDAYMGVEYLAAELPAKLEKDVIKNKALTNGHTLSIRGIQKLRIRDGSKTPISLFDTCSGALTRVEIYGSHTVNNQLIIPQVAVEQVVGLEKTIDMEEDNDDDYFGSRIEIVGKYFTIHFIIDNTLDRYKIELVTASHYRAIIDPLVFSPYALDPDASFLINAKFIDRLLENSKRRKPDEKILPLLAAYISYHQKPELTSLYLFGLLALLSDSARYIQSVLKEISI